MYYHILNWPFLCSKNVFDGTVGVYYIPLKLAPFAKNKKENEGEKVTQSISKEIFYGCIVNMIWLGIWKH